MSSAGVFGVLALLTMVVLPLAGGVLLIVFSRRRGPDHPACGKCGYNVHASIGSTSRCPECGADFGQVGITPSRAGRKRNPYMVTAGLIFIVVGVGSSASSLLLMQVRSAQSARGAAAVKAAAARAAAAQADAAEADDALSPGTDGDPEEE